MSGGEWVFAILGLVGMLASWFAGRWSAQQKKIYDPTPRCLCSHTIGEHVDGGGCKAEVRREHYYHSGSRNGYEWVRCACHKYYGPAVIIVSDDFYPGIHVS